MQASESRIPVCEPRGADYGKACKPETHWKKRRRRGGGNLITPYPFASKKKIFFFPLMRSALQAKHIHTQQQLLAV